VRLYQTLDQFLGIWAYLSVSPNLDIASHPQISGWLEEIGELIEA